MRLIGTLKSPYVRRTAISLEMLNIPFQLESLSTYQDIKKFSEINPVLKAPTLVCDDGEIIMDSSLILQFAEAALTKNRSLWPTDPAGLQNDFRTVSLALAACDKTVQIIHETQLRPASARWQSWLDRIIRQTHSAFDLLEAEVSTRASAFSKPNTQACITAAVVWRFARMSIHEILAEAHFPALTELSERMEHLPAFAKYSPLSNH